MIERGCTRVVVLLWRWAFKFPAVRYGWRNFLRGLLGNLQEIQANQFPCPEVCPIHFYVPGGFMVVMTRCRPLTDEEWAAFDPEAFCRKEDYVVPAEYKQDSFGVMPNGRIVAVDYGD